jgi:homoserine acetyltransferase
VRESITDPPEVKTSATRPPHIRSLPNFGTAANRRGVRDYDPSAGLERIQAALLAINSADDERNPPETGITERELKRVKNGRLYLIPASEDTRGHGTTGIAKFYTPQLRELLGTAPGRTMQSSD